MQSLIKNARLGVLFYRRPLARQHADAPERQSEYCFDGSRRSFHACHPLHFLFVPVPVHFTYRRSEHVWDDILPVSVVHLTTTFWLRASFFPNSLDDKTWYADAPPIVVMTIPNAINNLFIPAPCAWFVYINIIGNNATKYNGNYSRVDHGSSFIIR